MTRDVFLVPLDYTGCAFEVVGAASDLAGRLEAEVVLLAVVQQPNGVPADATIQRRGDEATMTVSELLDADARAHLEPLAQVFVEAGCRARTMLRHGDPAEAILQVAAELNANMIIMGTHGRAGVRRFFQGSVAETVLRQADCPVLTVRTHAPLQHPGMSAAQRQAQAEAEG